MRISENTPSRLRLRDRTLWISGICFAAAAILIARFAFDPDQSEQLIPAALSLIFGLAFLHATDVTFDKVERICAIRRLSAPSVALMCYVSRARALHSLISPTSGLRSLRCRTTQRRSPAASVW
jgi:hypothetical protein